MLMRIKKFIKTKKFVKIDKKPFFQKESFTKEIIYYIYYKKEEL